MTATATGVVPADVMATLDGNARERGMTPLPAWVRPGQVIIEKQRHAQERRIDGVYNWGVVVTGVASGRSTAISARNLYRYRPVER